VTEQAAVGVPLCPECLAELEMLTSYCWAPSISWCWRCMVIHDVEIDEVSQRWVVRS